MPNSEINDLEALSRVIAVINGKGGVLKTSVVANVAGQLARNEMRILAIDLDVQGNLKLDLGLSDHPQNDSGKKMVDAVWSGAPLPIVPDVRPGLDFIFGGRGLEVLGQLVRSPMAAEELDTGSVAGEFIARLSEVADDYDLILIDCPPGNGELQDIALAAARWVLIPTKTDQASLEGLLGVGPRVKRARQSNPDLGYLGVVITAHSSGATRVRRNTVDTLAEVEDIVPLFKTYIRYTESAAQDCRSRGQLAHELAVDAHQSQAQRLRELRSRRKREPHGNVIPLQTPPLSGSADSLAGDYERLAQEICQRISVAENATSDATSSAIPQIGGKA